jgi:hypothetical protein
MGLTVGSQNLNFTHRMYPFFISSSCACLLTIAASIDPIKSQNSIVVIVVVEFPRTANLRLNLIGREKKVWRWNLQGRYLIRNHNLELHRRRHIHAEFLFQNQNQKWQRLGKSARGRRMARRNQARKLLWQHHLPRSQMLQSR